MATTTKPCDVESDYDTSSVPDSSISFGSSTSALSETRRKPHKANEAAWEAVSRLRADRAGRVGLEQFRLLRRLGSGDIGNVYLCQIRNPVVGLAPCMYAMKVVDREALAIRKKLHRAEVEREILGLLDHPFLPTLYAEFDASHYSCFVMEFCPGGDLYAARQRLPSKRFSISSAKFYAAETLLALEYLHMMGIVYRDLKPENVLVREDGHIMLTDFDLSLKCDVVPKLVRRRTTTEQQPDDDDSCHTPCTRPVLSLFSASMRRRTKITTTITEHAENRPRHVSSHVTEVGPELVAEPISARSRSFVGTHEYLAPEVISGQGHGGAVDWWTLGVFLYEMVYGTTPFKGDNNERTLINILKQPLRFPRIGVSTRSEAEELVRVQDLIAKLLVKNPKKRIGGLRGAVEIKGHDFFKGVNWALIRSVKPPDVPRDSHRIRSGRAHRSDLTAMPKLMSKKERDAPYQIPTHHQQHHQHHINGHDHHHHFDYF